MSKIHATALVEPGAELGTDVDVGPFCFIASDTRIGDRCRLGPHVTIHAHTTLGDECRVHAGAVLGDIPQDLGFQEAVTRLEIGARCTFREGVTIHRGTEPGSLTRIGDDCFLMAFSHCGHNVQLGNGVIVANGVLFAGHVSVGDRAFISGNSMVHQFCRIGRLAMVGGGSGISKDVPPFCTTRPVTLNRVASLNSIGMRRAGLDPDQRRDIKQAYHLLYHAGLNVSQAVARIRVELSGAMGQEIADFVSESKRGICGWTDDPE